MYYKLNALSFINASFQINAAKKVVCESMNRLRRKEYAL